MSVENEVQIINEKMVKLYDKIYRLKYKLNLCSNCQCEEKEVKVKVKEDQSSNIA